MKPITTPGKASGRVSMATRAALPGNLLRWRNTPARPLTINVTTVVAAASASVASSEAKWFLSVMMVA